MPVANINRDYIPDTDPDFATIALSMGHPFQDYYPEDTPGPAFIQKTKYACPTCDEQPEDFLKHAALKHVKEYPKLSAAFERGDIEILM